MGYNQENYKRIREEYRTKYLRAREQAEARRLELHTRIPAVAEIDRELAKTGPEIMRISIEGGPGRQAALAALREKNDLLIKTRIGYLEAAGYDADYADLRYECEACGDSGYVDGKMCTCMRRALAMAGYETSGISELMQAQGFHNFSMDYYRYDPQVYEHMSNIFEVMRRFAEEFSESKMRNLLLTGGTGLGKTHLSSAVARRIIDRGYDVLYVSAVSMIGDFEYQRFGSNINGDDGANVIRYYDCDLLIIDDLGTEVTNQFTLSCIYNVVNIRLTRRKSTIINTNLSQRELRERYWDRLTSRLFGEYYPLAFVGRDIRRARIEEKSN